MIMKTKVFLIVIALNLIYKDRIVASTPKKENPNVRIVKYSPEKLCNYSRLLIFKLNKRNDLLSSSGKDNWKKPSSKETFTPTIKEKTINMVPLLRYYANYGVSRKERNTSNSCKEKCRKQVIDHCGDCTLNEINVLTVLCIEESCYQKI